MTYDFVPHIFAIMAALIQKYVKICFSAIVCYRIGLMTWNVLLKSDSPWNICPGISRNGVESQKNAAYKCFRNFKFKYVWVQINACKVY